MTAPVRYPGQGRRPATLADARAVSDAVRSGALARAHLAALRDTSVAGRR